MLKLRNYLALLVFCLFFTKTLFACNEPTDCDVFHAAIAAKDVYQNHIPHNISCDGVYSLSSVKEDGDGLYVEVYGDSQNGFIVAFRGSQEAQDWLDDFRQGIYGNGGDDNKQFQEAAKYFNDVQEVLNRCYPNAKKTIAGHSLGGALAQFVSYNAGPNWTTMTFNPGGLLPDYATVQNGCVFNYVNSDDVLHQIINPLLKQLKKSDPENIACGYIGTDSFMGGNGNLKYDFSGVSCSQNDINTIHDILLLACEYNDQFNKLNTEKIKGIFSSAIEMDALGKIFECISSDLASSWATLCVSLKDKPIKNGDLLFLAKGYDASLVGLGARKEIKDFKNALENAFATSGKAHLLGEEITTPGIPDGSTWEKLDEQRRLKEAESKNYTANSLLDTFQKKCDASKTNVNSALEGDGNTDQNNNGPLHDCFGSLPLINGRPSDFLDLIGQTVDNSDSSVQNALEAPQGTLDVLDAFTQLSEKVKLPGAEALDLANKYAGPVGEVLEIISTGSKVAAFETKCLTALATGSKEAFVNAVNSGVKDAVSTVAGWMGTALGKVVGGVAASEFGPVGSVLGSVGGGWLGGKVGEAAGNVLYDKYLAETVKQMAAKLFDLLCPEGSTGSAGGGVTLPPTTPGTSTSTSGADGSGPGTPGGGISDPAQTINPDASSQPAAPSTGAGYKRDQNYINLSK